MLQRQCPWVLAWALQCMKVKPSVYNAKQTISLRNLNMKKSKYPYFIHYSSPKFWETNKRFEIFIKLNQFRRLMILEDQYKTACEELKEKKENLKVIRPPTAKMAKDSQKIKLLENQLEKALVKYNDL